MIRVTYDEVLTYRGPRTIGRFKSLLHHPTDDERELVRGLRTLAREMRAAQPNYTLPHINVEIIENLNTKLEPFQNLFILLSLYNGLHSYMMTNNSLGLSCGCSFF